MSAPPWSTRTQRIGYTAALSLTLTRLVLAAPLVGIGIAGGSGRAVAIILIAGFVSDVYDGVVARRFDVATPGLRRLDSAVDTVFYLAAAWCAWRLHPDAIVRHRWLIGAVIATQILNHAFEIWKFGREASYHAWSAKAWGAALFASLIFLFVAGDDWLLTIALILGLISHAENALITWVLPAWDHDVKSVFVALKRRRVGRDSSVAGL